MGRKLGSIAVVLCVLGVTFIASSQITMEALAAENLCNTCSYCPGHPGLWNGFKFDKYGTTCYPFCLPPGGCPPLP